RAARVKGRGEPAPHESGQKAKDDRAGERQSGDAAGDGAKAGEIARSTDLPAPPRFAEAPGSGRFGGVACALALAHSRASIATGSDSSPDNSRALAQRRTPVSKPEGELER